MNMHTLTSKAGRSALQVVATMTAAAIVGLAMSHRVQKAEVALHSQVVRADGTSFAQGPTGAANLKVTPTIELGDLPLKPTPEDTQRATTGGGKPAPNTVGGGSASDPQLATDPNAVPNVAPGGTSGAPAPGYPLSTAATGSATGGPSNPQSPPTAATVPAERLRCNCSRQRPVRRLRRCSRASDLRSGRRRFAAHSTGPGRHCQFTRHITGTFDR
jgi:hypothetical protein